MTGYRITASAVAVLVVMFLSGCGSSGRTSSGGTAAPPAANEVVIKNFAFVPATITVKAGTTVTWVNEDPAAHNIVADHGSFPSSQDLSQGDKYSHTFNTAGTYRYICGLHTYMTGTVVVTG